MDSSNPSQSAPDSNFLLDVPLEKAFALSVALHENSVMGCSEARDLDSDSSVHLWRSKARLSNEQAATFIERMKMYRAIKVPRPSIRRFGVDSQGRAFVSTDMTQLHPFVRTLRAPEQTTRMVRQLLKTVSALHARNFVIGEVTENTFLVDATGDMMLVGIGVLGSGERSDVLSSPETRNGQLPTKKSDCFAIGALIYRAVTGKHYATPTELNQLGEGVLRQLVLPSQFNHVVPAWADALIQKSLCWNPNERAASVDELLELLIEEERQVEKQKQRQEIKQAFLRLSEEPEMQALLKVVGVLTAILVLIATLKNEGVFDRFFVKTVPTQVVKNIDFEKFQKALYSPEQQARVNAQAFRERIQAIQILDIPRVDREVVEAMMVPKSLDERESLRMNISNALTLESHAAAKDRMLKSAELGTLVAQTQLGRHTRVSAFIEQEGWRFPLSHLAQAVQDLPSISELGNQDSSPLIDQLSALYGTMPAAANMFVGALMSDFANAMSCGFMPNATLRHGFSALDIELFAGEYSRKTRCCSEEEIHWLDVLADRPTPVALWEKAVHASTEEPSI